MNLIEIAKQTENDVMRKKLTTDDKVNLFLNDVKDYIAEVCNKGYKIEDIRKILNAMLEREIKSDNGSVMKVRDKYGIKLKNAVSSKRLNKFIRENGIKQATNKRQTKEKVIQRVGQGLRQDMKQQIQDIKQQIKSVPSLQIDEEADEKR